MKAQKLNYIRRMLLSYLPILFLTVSMLIFIFLSIFSGINARNAIQANEMTAAFIVNMVDNSLKSIADDAQKVAVANMQLRQFLEEPSDRALEFDVSKALSNLMDLRYGLIDSIYLFRALDGKVLDQNALRSIEQFPDRSYINNSIKQALTGGWSSPRIKYNDEADYTSVTSLIIKIPQDSGSLGHVMINVKLSSLYSFINQMVNKELTDVQLSDPQGRLFFTGQSAATNNALNAVLTSDYTQWTYKVSIKDGKWFDNLVQGNMIWLMLGLGSIILAISSTLYVTRRSYRPIETILHRINLFSSSVKQADQRGSKDEFAFIDQAIERLITTNMDFQERQQEHQVIRRQQFLQMLLKGEYENNQAEWEQEWQHFGLAAGNYIVAVAELDHYFQFELQYSPKDQSLFKFIISSVAVEVAELSGKKIITEWLTKNQLVIFLVSEHDGDLKHTILQMSEQIRNWVEKNLKFTVTIGIGSTARRELEIKPSFDDAVASVSRKVTLGINQVIDAAEVEGNPHEDWYNYLEMIRTTVRQLRTSEAEWETGLARLFAEMGAQGLRKDDVERQLHYFLFHLEYELKKAWPEAAEDWVRNVKPDMLLAIDQSDTLEQLEADFRLVLEQLFEQIAELMKNRRHDALMKEVRNYVTQHFCDSNLSLGMLSDRFQINSKYLSHLFKESMGQNFIDFLIYLRVEHAKKLLSETEIPVGDVAEHVGYTNTTSFIRTFKKMAGESPGQFRDSCRQKSQILTKGGL
ncbi:MAG: AraC family transcriptional regulator [Paenibacillaceae bacterium]|jgi:AraC-like DNA-binding protein|nr:AraC family transcriptional regulator [Paenibacillaceae bacterium]